MMAFGAARRGDAGEAQAEDHVGNVAMRDRLWDDVRIGVLMDVWKAVGAEALGSVAGFAADLYKHFQYT